MRFQQVLHGHPFQVTLRNLSIMRVSPNSSGGENPSTTVTFQSNPDSDWDASKQEDGARGHRLALKLWPSSVQKETGKTVTPSALRVVVLVTFVFALVAVLLDVFYLIPVPPCDPARDYFPYKLTIDFAGRTIQNLTYHNIFVDLDVRTSKGVFEYRLLKSGCPVNDMDTDRQVLLTNPSSVYISEGPILGFYEPLIPNVASLRYVNKKSYIYSPAVRDRVDGELTEELENDSFEINYTRLSNDPDLSLSLIGDFGIENYQDAKTGKPFLAVTEVLEVTPLGRAEWIKVLGLLFEKSEEADNLFRRVVRDYNIVKEKASASDERPSVFFNAPMNDTHWSVPNGLQYMSRYAQDANADYKFANNGKESTEVLTFPEIRKEFQSTQVLLNVNKFPVSNDVTLDEFIRSFDDRKNVQDLLKDLRAVRCGDVWSNQKRISPDKEADDFYESAAYRADLVLEDFVKILHPSLDIKEELTYMYSYGSGTPGVVGGDCPSTTSGGDSSRMVRHQ